MSQKRVIILYNGEETKMEFNLEETNTYDLLMHKIQSHINDCDPSFHYNLMAINTSEPYTLVESDNYMKIMEEKIPDGDLKLFFNKIDMNAIDNLNVDDDDDFVIENGQKKEEKKEDKIIEENEIKNENEPKIEENQLKINDEIKNNNSNEKNEIINNDNYENDDEKLFSQTNMILNRIQQVMGESNTLYKHSKTMVPSNNINNNNFNNNIINQNNNEINNNASNFLYNNKEYNNNNLIMNEETKNKNNNNKFNKNNIIDEEEEELTNNLIKPDTFNQIKCSICKDSLKGIKYICCVCENLILCTGCEAEHYHPCIKCKSPFLSNLTDMYNFITNSYKFKLPSNNFFSKLFKKEYDIIIVPLTDQKICIRPNKKFVLPVKIINSSKEVVKSSQFEIIPKDNKLIQINDDSKYVLGPNSSKTLKMKCASGENLGKEKITFYGFSEQLCFKNPNNLNFTLEFEINNDEDEEKINRNLEYNDNVIMYSKEHKSLVLEILENIGDNDRSKSHINKVFNILIENDWDKKRSINNIKALKK
jgi:hypothetical protein